MTHFDPKKSKKAKNAQKFNFFKISSVYTQNDHIFTLILKMWFFSGKKAANPIKNGQNWPKKAKNEQN